MEELAWDELRAARQAVASYDGARPAAISEPDDEPAQPHLAAPPGAALPTTLTSQPLARAVEAGQAALAAAAQPGPTRTARTAREAPLALRRQSAKLESAQAEQALRRAAVRACLATRSGSRAKPPRAAAQTQGEIQDMEEALADYRGFPDARCRPAGRHSAR